MTKKEARWNLEYVALPEGIFSEQMLAGANDISIDLRVQKMGQGAVDRFYFRIGQEIMIILIKKLRIRIPAEPVQIFRIGIAGGDDDRTGQIPQQMQPAEGHAGELAAHETAADDAEGNGIAHGRGASFPGSALPRT